MKTILICVCATFLLTYSQKQSQPPSLTVPGCREFSFEGRINGGEEYARELGDGLRLRLLPLRQRRNENSGWTIEVQPVDSDTDYAFPVNPPFHFGNSQWLATGYGQTVEQQLQFQHQVFFVLNQKEYEHAQQAVDDAFAGKDPHAAEKFLKDLPTMQSASLTLKPSKYEVTNGGEQISWMSFSVSVITPAAFHPAQKSVSKAVTCPSASS